jgi:PAS domain S-box-containing protein
MPMDAIESRSARRFAMIAEARGVIAAARSVQSRTGYFLDRLADRIRRRAEAESSSQGGEERDRRPLWVSMDDIDAIIWEGDPVTGRLVYVSRRAEDWLGYPVARWLGESDFWAAHVHEDDRGFVEKVRRRCLTGDADQELEYRLIAADGRAIWFREATRVIRDRRGVTIGLCGMLWNISHRKKVERRLYTDRRQLAERLDDMAYLHDLFGGLSPLAELEPLAGEILGSVASIVGAEKGVLYLRDQGGDGWRLHAAVGLPESLTDQIRLIPPWSPWRGRILAASDLVAVEDVLGLPGHAADLPVIRSGGIRGIFSLPLLSRAAEAMGAVAVVFERPHRPAERAAALAASYVRRASAFVENALLRSGVLRESDPVSPMPATPNGDRHPPPVVSAGPGIPAGEWSGARVGGGIRPGGTEIPPLTSQPMS